MKTRISLLVILFSLFALAGYTQEKTKKQLKEEQKIEKQKQIDSLVNSKTFVFNARTALPQGTRSVNLSSSSYFMNLSPELIKSELPFYGKAYAGVGYGGEQGMKFEGKPDDYKVEKGKKNYSVSAVVKGNNDTYRISLSVGFEGGTTLTITSNNRSPMSFNGDVVAPEKQK
jgi:hypothetical protein